MPSTMAGLLIHPAAKSTDTRPRKVAYNPHIKISSCLGAISSCFQIQPTVAGSEPMKQTLSVLQMSCCPRMNTCDKVLLSLQAISPIPRVTRQPPRQQSSTPCLNLSRRGKGLEHYAHEGQGRHEDARQTMRLGIDNELSFAPPQGPLP